jgi:PTS system nitrogen regulatory IIA component
MEIQQLLSPGRTRCRIAAGDKAAALAALAELIGADVAALDTVALNNGLAARERLGSTGLGDGIAIPHCRLKSASILTGALITLAEPIEFDALDDEPVDILFALIAPEDAAQAHLSALAMLAEHFSQAEFRRRLRTATSDTELFAAALA